MAYVPLRPAGKFNLSQAEMNCLTWFVLSGCTQAEAYTIWVAPDMKNSPKAAKQYSIQFFAIAEARNYITKYTETLNATSKAKEMTAEEREAKANKAIMQFTDKVVNTMTEVNTLDDMDSVAKLADRLGILGDEDSTQEAPRRYLPMRCSQCPMKKFIDEQVELGNIIVKPD